MVFIIQIIFMIILAVNMNTKIKLTMALALAAVALMSVAAVTTLIQEVSAQDTTFEFKQKQENTCSGFAGCSNSGSITFSPP